MATIPSYTKTTWENGTTLINEDNLNKIENQLESITDAKDTATATGTSLTLTDCVTDICKVKSNSVNLFDKDTAPTQAWIFDTTNMKIIASANGKSTYIPCKANTTYTISRIADIRFQIATTEETPNTNVAISNYGENNTGTTMRITTGASAKYLVVYYWHNSSSITEQAVLDTLQIEEGDTATTYNPYNTTAIINPFEMEMGGISAGEPVERADRIRSKQFIEVYPNTMYTIKNAIGKYANVYYYDAEQTYIGQYDTSVVATPYSITTPNNCKYIKVMYNYASGDFINSIIDGITQILSLTPQGEKLAFTYDSLTNILSDGSVTMEYNTQSRLLNNDDMQVAETLQQHIDYNAKNISKSINILEDNVTLGDIMTTLGCADLGTKTQTFDLNDLQAGQTCRWTTTAAQKPQNAPAVGGQCFCISNFGGSGASGKRQIVFLYNSDAIYSRYYWGSTGWSDWTMLNVRPYSTSERQIGTWIDGRPLYRKVITETIPSGTTSTEISLGVSNIRLVQRAEVRFNAVGSGDYVFNSYYNSASDYMRFFMRSNKLQIRLGSNTSGFNIVAIVEYTKSTD